MTLITALVLFDYDRAKNLLFVAISIIVSNLSLN